MAIGSLIQKIQASVVMRGDALSTGGVALWLRPLVLMTHSTTLTQI